MKLYVGLDVGLEEASLCIVDGEGTLFQNHASRELAAHKKIVRRCAGDMLFRVQHAHWGILKLHQADATEQPSRDLRIKRKALFGSRLVIDKLLASDTVPIIKAFPRMDRSGRK